jgi:hypothetical protein
MSYALVAALLAAVVAFAVFVFLVRARWFARFETGFLVALMLAVGGSSFVSASLFGLWGYERGRAILVQSLHAAMSNVADVIEADTLDGISEAHRRLTGLAEEVEAAKSSQDETALRKLLLQVQGFDLRFVHLHVIDADGKTVVESNTEHETVPPDEVALSFNLQGKPFTSDPFFSSTFGHYLLRIGVPTKDASGVTGAINAWFDIQTELVSRLEAARFGKTGRAALVDGNGRIFAHANPKRVGDDVSSYSAGNPNSYTAAIEIGTAPAGLLVELRALLQFCYQ